MSDSDVPPDPDPAEWSEEEEMTIIAQPVTLRPADMQQQLANLMPQSNAAVHVGINGAAADEFGSDGDDDEQHDDQDDDGDIPELEEDESNSDEEYEDQDDDDDEDDDDDDDDDDDMPPPLEAEKEEDEECPPPLKECNSSEDEDDDAIAGSHQPQPSHQKQDAEGYRAEGNRLFGQERFKEVF